MQYSMASWWIRVRDRITQTQTLSLLNEKMLDAAVGASFLAILLAFVGVANFMGLELVPSGDNRGIGCLVRIIPILLHLTTILGS